MSNREQPNRRPSEVLYAQILLWSALGLTFCSTLRNMLTGGQDHRISIGLAVLTVFLIFTPLAFLVFEIGKGRNWARIAYLVLTVIGLLADLLQTLQSPGYVPRNPLYMVGAVLNIVALSMLFRGEASAWFRRHKEPPEAHAAQSDQIGPTASTSAIPEETQSGEDPLFVLRYRKSVRFLLIVASLIIIVPFPYL
jgi:hypothetical protein